MAHVLARLRNVEFSLIKDLLEQDAPLHAKEGMVLEHLWRNADDPNEVVFLFHADDVTRARHFIDRMHTQARKENPHANLPTMTFLE